MTDDREDKLIELKSKYLKYYRDLPVQKLAASYIGKDEDTIIRWRKEDADFADQVQHAKAEWAMENSKKVRSREWLLERVMKDHFAPRSPLLDDKGKPIPLLTGVVDVPSDDSTTQAE